MAMARGLRESEHSASCARCVHDDGGGMTRMKQWQHALQLRESTALQRNDARAKANPHEVALLPTHSSRCKTGGARAGASGVVGAQERQRQSVVGHATDESSVAAHRLAMLAQFPYRANEAFAAHTD